MTTLSSEFKKMIKQYIAPFIHTQKQQQLLMKTILVKYLNQFIVQLYQTYKNI